MSDKKGKAKSQNLQRMSTSAPKGQKKTRTTRKGRSRRAIGLVGLAPRATNPTRAFRMTSGRRLDGSSCRIKGTDFLTAVTIGGTSAAAGDVLVSQVVNPAVLGIARLATMAKLYERYKFRSLKFRYSPVANATISGQLIGYVDYDTYDDPTGISGVQNLQRAAAHYGEKPVQIWQGSESPIFWEIKDVDPMTDLYVDNDGTDPRWTNQGRFVLLAASAIASSTACGNIYLDYDIEFFIPQVEMTPTTGYSYRLTGGGSMSQSAYWGTAPVPGTWNNLPITQSANVLTLPAGSYQISQYIVGTTLSPTQAVSGNATAFNTLAVVSAAATQWCASTNVIATASWTYTLGGTAAAVSQCVTTISLMPSNAQLVSLRRICQLERALKAVGDLAQMRDSLRVSEGKEAKEVNPSRVLNTTPEPMFHSVEPEDRHLTFSSSTSSVSSAVAPATRTDYVMVRRA